MSKTPLRERIERFLIYHTPAKHIPVHGDDAEAAGKLKPQYTLPFKVLGSHGTFGGTDG